MHCGEFGTKPAFCRTSPPNLARQKGQRIVVIIPTEVFAAGGHLGEAIPWAGACQVGRKKTAQTGILADKTGAACAA